MRQAESALQDHYNTFSISRVQPRLFWACCSSTCQGVSAEGDPECTSCPQEARPYFAKWPLRLANTIAYTAPWEKREFLRHVDCVYVEHEESELARRTPPGLPLPARTLPLTPRAAVLTITPRSYVPSELPASPPKRLTRQEQVEPRQGQPTEKRSTKSPSASRSPSRSPAREVSRSRSSSASRSARRRERVAEHRASQSRSPSAHRPRLPSSSPSSAYPSSLSTAPSSRDLRPAWSTPRRHAHRHR